MDQNPSGIKARTLLLDVWAEARILQPMDTGAIADASTSLRFAQHDKGCCFRLIGRRRFMLSHPCHA